MMPQPFDLRIIVGFRNREYITVYYGVMYPGGTFGEWTYFPYVMCMN